MTGNVNQFLFFHTFVRSFSESLYERINVMLFSTAVPRRREKTVTLTLSVEERSHSLAVSSKSSFYNYNFPFIHFSKPLVLCREHTVGREIPWAHGRLAHTYTVSYQYTYDACLWIVRETGGNPCLHSNSTQKDQLVKQDLNWGPSCCKASVLPQPLCLTSETG